MNNKNLNQFIHYTSSASTASPAFIPCAITSDDNLKRKTHLVVIYPKGDSLLADIYRESYKKKGYFSVDIYSFDNTKWKYLKKHKEKYKEIPVPPKGSYKKQVGGVMVWSGTRFSEKKMKNIQKLVNIL